MASAEKNLRKFEQFLEERETNKDWGAYINEAGTALSRSAVCEACQFPRSTLRTNPGVKQRLAEKEEFLRDNGVLKRLPLLVDMDVALPAAVDQRRSSRIQAAWVQIHHAEAALEEVRNLISHYIGIIESLEATGSLPADCDYHPLDKHGDQNGE